MPEKTYVEIYPEAAVTPKKFESVAIKEALVVSGVRFVALGIYAVPNETQPARLICERRCLQITLFHKRSHLVLCALHNRVFHPTVVAVRGVFSINPVARQRFRQQVFHRCGGDFSVRRVDFSVRRRLVIIACGNE